jgi:hypothetical protein
MPGPTSGQFMALTYDRISLVIDTTGSANLGIGNDLNQRESEAVAGQQHLDHAGRDRQLRPDVTRLAFIPVRGTVSGRRRR